jgi:putative transposase
VTRHPLTRTFPDKKYKEKIRPISRFFSRTAIKILTVIDEFSRESLAILVERRLNSDDVLHCLTDLFMTHGPPAHIRSDNGPEFTAHAVRRCLERTGVRTLFIEPGSPWENGYCESFNGKLRDEVLDREIFYTLREAQVLIEQWRIEYNTFRPHSSLGYRPPAPEAFFKTFIVQNTPEMISSPRKARTLETLT